MHIAAMRNNKDDYKKITTTSLQPLVKSWGYPAILMVSAILTLNSEKNPSLISTNTQAYKDNLLE